MRRLAPLAATLLWVAACATPRPPAPRLPVPPSSLAPLLQRLQAEATGRRTLRGLGSVRVETRSASGRVRQVIVVARPASIRLETQNLFGQTQALLVTDGERFLILDGNGFEGGRLYDGLLGERLGLELTVEEAVEALLAAPVPDPEEALRAYSVGDEHWMETDRRRIRIGPDGELRALGALGAGGELRWEAEYERWREVVGGRYPFRVRLSFPEGVEAQVSLREVELNPVLPPGLFDPVPPGERR